MESIPINTHQYFTRYPASILSSPSLSISLYSFNITSPRTLTPAPSPLLRYHNHNSARRTPTPLTPVHYILLGPTPCSLTRRQFAPRLHTAMGESPHISHALYGTDSNYLDNSSNRYIYALNILTYI